MFKIICFILFGTTFMKSITGILFHEKLYGWAKKHYKKNKRSWTTIFLLIYGGIIFFLTWYATLFDYVKYGWIIFTLVTLSSIKLFGLIFNWKKVSKKFVNFIEKSSHKLWILDIILFFLSTIFLFMGIFLY